MGRMGTSLYDKSSLSFPSVHSSSSYDQHNEEAFDPFRSSSFKKEERRKKKKQDKPADVLDSLEQFLVASQVEDFLFEQNTAIEKKQKRDDGGIDESFQILDPDEGASLFDAEALSAAANSVRSKKKSRSKKKRLGGRKPQKMREQEEEAAQEKETQLYNDENFEAAVIKVFQTSLRKILDEHADDTSISLSELKESMHSTSKQSDTKPKRRAKRTSQGSITSESMHSTSKQSASSQQSDTKPKRRTKRTSQGSITSESMHSTSKERSRSRQSQTQRPIQRSGGATRLTIGIRPRSSMDSSNHTNRKSNDLKKGLSNLDKQGRRERMKQGYRTTPSVTSGRGGGSVSGFSITSQSTRRSHKRTGFEGGALNAIMGNEDLAKVASRGGDISSVSGSVVSAPADEAFLNERRLGQNKILDEALKQKWAREKESEVDAKSRDESVDSQKEIQSKGIMKQVKKAAKKTKSGVQKRSSRKGYDKVEPDEEEKRRKKSSKKKESSSGETSPSTRKTKKRSSRRKSSESKPRSNTSHTSNSNMHNSMSGKFPDFSLTENSQVVWWDL